ncbi:hypothetical protein F5Y15DRAFT_417631 [Xylariaceae sp. FL0016]|nr:hypothetical protein F5Y15DRAFT_417631 [Xylariaceae sp. FL0016]
MSTSMTLHQPASGDGSWMMRNVGNHLRILNAQHTSYLSHKSHNQVNSNDNGNRFTASYDWVGRQKPTIFAPGGARIWLYEDDETAKPRPLKEDFGFVFRDMNNSKAARYPWEPLFRAMDATGSPFVFDLVHVVVDNGVLQKLFRHCSQKVTGDFRMELYRIGKTLIMEEHEEHEFDHISRKHQPSFNHPFKADYTKPLPGLESSIGHYRAVRYELGNVSCVVRSHIDAEFRSAPIRPTRPSAHAVSTSDAIRTENNERPLEYPLNWNFQEAMPSKVDRRLHRSTEVVRRGPGPSRSGRPAKLLAVPTAELDATYPVATCMPELWLGRIPCLIVGGHDASGRIVRTRPYAAVEDYRDWEEVAENQLALRKLSVLLSEIREVMTVGGKKRCVAVYAQNRHLAMYEWSPSRFASGRREALPADLVRRFWSKEAYE